MNAHSTEGHDSHGELGHIVPFSIYRNVLLALLVLTVLTVVVAKVDFFDFGEWNIALAMFIASIKAILVALFFMHLKFEDKMTWTYALFPIFLLVLLMAGLFIDEPLREKHKPVEIKDSLAANK